MPCENDSLQFIKQRPECLNGSCRYQGTPYTTQETIDVIGEEGIKKIAERLKEMLKWKETMFRINDSKKNGLSFTMEFADYCSRRVIDIVGEAGEMDPDRYIKIHRGLDGFLIPQELKKNNFKLLKETDYYLIEVSSHPYPKYFDEYMSKIS